MGPFDRGPRCHGCDRLLARTADGGCPGFPVERLPVCVGRAPAGRPARLCSDCYGPLMAPGAPRSRGPVTWVVRD